MKIVLDTKKSVEENAQAYFEKAKKAKKKLEGARKALDISRKRLIAEQDHHESKLERLKDSHARQKDRKVRKAEWFEKFRWFFSSEGFLVIGGRDATTNEIVIKKHAEPEDIVFHTDMAGSPFFVIKTEGKEPSDKTLQEVANATLCFSRAWKMGLMTTPAFWVRPGQVTKEANQGEFLPKGAFMIRGKTNYITPQVDCAIGDMEDGRIMCGPADAVRKHCSHTIILGQGDKKPSEIARIIKKKIGGELDEIIKVMPSGTIGVLST